MTDDLDRIMAVMEAAFDPAYGEAWNRRQIGDALITAGTRYLLADSRGGAPAPGVPAAGFTLSRQVLDEEELLLLAVTPAERRRGIGAALLIRTIKAAQARGVTRMFLEMRDGNEAAALYQAHGFTPVGRRPHYYQRGTGDSRDAITFAKTL